MRTELIRIATPTHPLDGAYYTPDGPEQGRGDVLPRQPDELLRLRRALSRAAYHGARLRVSSV